ncbi:hypothetical protein AGMMS50229_05390 [Campylobacterota bacterium]|nr:hypothetical protein AGMMS50229_05390 [Campylobacterota bacterium]
MKRFDLRELGTGFVDRMTQIIEKDVQNDEVAIFIFEVRDFSSVQKSADAIKALGYELLNSLKYNEVDWTLSVRKRVVPQIAKETIAQSQSVSEASN